MSAAGATLAVVGAGGNVGSHLVPLLARLPAVGRLVLVDRGSYQAADLVTQAITPRDVGRPKARVQARRARRLRPQLAVEALHADLAAVPPGRLRGAALLACLDGRAARQRVNELARWLGMPWIDGGVRADGLLARADLYGAGEESACLECAWSEQDYAALETADPCGEGEPAPTGAPAALGALAAALQALLCGRLLAGEAPPALPEGGDGWRVVLAAGHGRAQATRLP
ncbi:MAG TPA: ThiF family adenylyltransferase, partial [Thermoanaerobaculia bacterium]|nr:ThiF family adenylyltransferase [Thermoanaerobaculia bacterium]